MMTLKQLNLPEIDKKIRKFLGRKRHFQKKCGTETC
jgi:hypothetical protein